MRNRKITLQESLRIIYTITAKDVRELFKNYILITILLGIGVMMVLNKGIVVLLARGTQKPTLAVYVETMDVLEKLELQQDFNLISLPSEAELFEVIAESRVFILGIALDEDLANRITGVDDEKNQLIELAAYTPYWADDIVVGKNKNIFETRLSSLFQTQIRLQIDENRVYPDRESRGQPFMVAIYVTIGALLSAAATAPFLMVEEKQSKTLDSLLISPANYTQIILSKFITGLLPGLLGGLLILGANYQRVTHWGFAFLMLLIGNTMIVLIGLWIGLKTNHPVNLSLFQLVVLILLITPILVAPSMPPNWPGWARGFLNYFPSTGFSRLVRDAFTSGITFKTILPDLLSLLGCSVFFFGLLLRKLSRLDR